MNYDFFEKPKEEKPKIIKPKKVIPNKIKDNLEFSNIEISQDDLWFLYRLKFGKGTRMKRSELLPKFTEVFNRNLKEMKN